MKVTVIGEYSWNCTNVRVVFFLLLTLICRVYLEILDIMEQNPVMGY